MSLQNLYSVINQVFSEKSIFADYNLLLGSLVDLFIVLGVLIFSIVLNGFIFAPLLFRTDRRSKTQIGQ